MTSEPDLVRLRDVAIAVAGEAAALVRRMRGGPLGFHGGVVSKSTEVDVATEVDTAAERLVRERLAELRPGEPVLGEEEGGTVAADTLSWVVDPIDGTVNFLYGLPQYAVSIAACRGERSLAGAIVEPASGRVFSAARGHGATLAIGAAEPVRLGVNSVERLEVSLVATGFAYDRARRGRQAKLCAELATEVRDFRRGGSAALELCAVAAGWTDAYYEHGLHHWDWAAGLLIAEEAGATVRAPGATPDLGADLLLASAPGIAAPLQTALAEAGSATV